MRPIVLKAIIFIVRLVRRTRAAGAQHDPTITVSQITVLNRPPGSSPIPRVLQTDPLPTLAQAEKAQIREAVGDVVYKRRD